MELNESQASLDNSIVVSPPEDEKSSFSSPRVRQKAVRIRPQPTALNSATNLEDNEESIEQKYLKKRIEERPLHNPHLPKDVQVKSIMLKSRQPYDEVHDNKERISHLAAEEERVQRLTKLNENESGNTLVLERGVPRMTSPQLVPLNNENLQKSSRRSNSADSEHSSDMRRKLDSQESNRSDTLYGMKGKADSKAMKKIEWLENYVELRNKQSIPLNSAELERYRQVLSKLSGVEGQSDVKENADGSATVGNDSIVPTTVQHTNTEPKLKPEPPSQSMPRPQSKPESKSDEAIKFAEELEAENDHEDVSSLKKQLTEAKREIEKLRLERALLHAKSEIKKLKTEITYGQEIENEEVNIDKIVGIDKKKDSSSASTLSGHVSGSSPRVSSPASGVSSPIPRISSPGSKSDLPAKAIRNTLLRMKSVEENPQQSGSPKRTTVRRTAHGTKMGLKGIGGGANDQGKTSSRWSALSRRVSTEGSETLVEEHELEDYREEKRKRKKKKKFLQDIEDSISRDAAKTKANPQVLKQMQSFDFLNFLDSLDGLEGNTLKKKTEQADTAKVE